MNKGTRVKFGLCEALLCCHGDLTTVQQTSEGMDVAKRHRNQSVAMIVMSQPSASKCLCKRGSLARTNSCTGTEHALARPC
jgi:hypothetical protein